MESDKRARSFSKDVLSYVWFRYKMIDELPDLIVEPLFESFVENLRDIVLVESYFTLTKWKKFLRKHSERITSSPTTYATYLIFSCYLVKSHFRNIFECFLRVLTLVAEFSIYAKSKDHPEFIHVSHDIFIAFYMKEIKEEFKVQGHWKKFKSYIQKRECLRYSEGVNKAIDNGKTPSEIVENVLKAATIKTPKVGGYFLNDLAQETIESDQATLELVGTIASTLESLQKVATEGQPLGSEQEKAPETLQDEETNKGDQNKESENISKSDSSEKIKEAKLQLQEALADLPVLNNLIKFVLLHKPETSE